MAYKKYIRLILILVFLQAFSCAAYSVEITENLSLNGYFTIDATMADDNGIVLPSILGSASSLNKDEVVYDGTLIGVQLDYNTSDNLSLAIQGISAKQSADEYDPILEWAYLKYDFGNDLFLRAGKLKLPFLQGTELRYVGYSRLWVRPLVPSNGAGGFDDYEGIELLKTYFIGDYNLKLHAAYGESDHFKDVVKDNEVRLLSTQIEKDDNWLKIALFNAYFDLYTYNDLIIQRDAKINMISLEAKYLVDSFIFHVGVTKGEAESYPDMNISYMSLGYQIDRLTPYIMYNARSAEFSPVILPAGAVLPPGPPPPGTLPLSADGERSSEAYALGFRYDIGDSYALKIQWDSVTMKDTISPLPSETDADVYTVVFEGLF